MKKDKEEQSLQTKAGRKIKQVIARTETRTRTKANKYANRQQLPHLCFWFIIIATNLLGCCSLTQTISTNGSRNKVSIVTQLLSQVAAKSYATANTTTTTAAFETEIDSEVTRPLRGIGGIEEINNKPVEINENVYGGKNRNNRKCVSCSNTSTVEWINLADVFNGSEYIKSKATTDEIGSGGLLSTGLPFNNSHENLFTFHEECLANSSTLSQISTFVLYSVVCVVGLFGNTLVIWVVLKFNKMQTVTNIYILNLAIADECFLIGIPFLLYTMRVCSWKFGDYMCKAYMVSTSITQFTSSIFLLIMAADRYIAVCHPIESPKYRTLRIAKLVSIFAWLTSVILMMPVILFASTVRQEDGTNFSCNIDWPEVYKKHSGTTFILYTFLLGFATPLCFILVFYYLVIRKLHSVQQKHKSREKKRSHRKVTKLVLTVITVYLLCWLPHWISQVSLINNFVGQRELSRFEILLFLLFGCLAYSNSAMNPILYAFLSENFRKSFTRAFTCVNRSSIDERT